VNHAEDSSVIFGDVRFRYAAKGAFRQAAFHCPDAILVEPGIIGLLFPQWSQRCKSAPAAIAILE
jgi:hypothetical protein